MRCPALLIALGTLGLAAGVPAWAHPELARHGYGNCTSCHVSPSGGGVLNEYGRSLSREVLSTWGSESEAAPFYGIAPLPKWLNAQAFIRGVQFIRDNKQVREGQLVAMQTDLELAGTYRDVTAVVAAGLDPSVINNSSFKGTHWLSPRHYLVARMGEKHSVRAGKFRTDYGLNIANHGAATRAGLGWGPGSETYNLEYGFQGETISGSATAVFGELDDEAPSERGIAFNGAFFLSERYKVGASFYHGTQSGASRTLMGPYVILGFTPRLFLLSELDVQLNGSQSTTVSYHRVGYDVVQGIQPYLTAETNGSTNAWGAGMMLNPRPHVELQLEAKRKSAINAATGPETAGFLAFSFYL